jgi:hypothetical protein
MSSDGSFMAATPRASYIYTYGQSTETFTVGNTTVTSADFTMGDSLTTTLANIVAAFNGKAGNCTAYQASGTEIAYVAKVAGTAGNSYVATRTIDAAGIYSFTNTTLSGGTAASSGNLTSSAAALILGTAFTPSFNSAGDVGVGGNFTVNGSTKFSGSVALGSILTGQTGNPLAGAATHCYVGFNTTANTTYTLPASPVLGQLLIIKDETGNAAAKNIAVNRSGSQLIDGATSKLVSTAYGVLRLLYVASNVWITW